MIYPELKHNYGRHFMANGGTPIDKKIRRLEQGREEWKLKAMFRRVKGDVGALCITLRITLELRR